MTDVEREIRETLQSKAGEALISPWPEPEVLRRARRRQVGTVLVSALTVAAVVAGSIIGLGAIRSANRGTPANEPVVTRSLHGISNTMPESWYLIDPDAEGLNGPGTSSDLPRLILAVSPTEVGDAFGCPGLSGGPPPTFLMTIQEEPLALSGPSSAPWPVSLQPMEVGSPESGCYPRWAFERAWWTTGGRTFQATVALVPDVSDADRAALLDAFASMAFEPASEPPQAVTIATGTDPDGGPWTLYLQNTVDGYGLTFQFENDGGGGGCCFGATPLHGDLTLDGTGTGEGPGDITVLASERVARVVFRASSGEQIDGGLYPVPEGLTHVPQIGLILVPHAIPLSGELIAYEAGGDVLARVTIGDNPEQPAATTEQQVVWARLHRARDDLSVGGDQDPGTLATLDATVAVNIDPGVRWNDSTTAVPDQVSIRGQELVLDPSTGAVVGSHLVIVSPTATGQVYCIGIQVDSNGTSGYRYGTQDAQTYDECRGGWG